MTCICLSVLFPQRPTREVGAAREVARLAEVDLIEAEVPFLSNAGNLLSQVQDAPYVRATAYVPMRNLVFYAVAGYFAEVHGCDVIVAGHIRSDADAYSDAEPPFFQAIERVYGLSLAKSYLTDNRGIRILLPLADLADRDVAALARTLQVPLMTTWSCLHDLEIPCGVCVSCRDRAAALSIDPP